MGFEKNKEFFETAVKNEGLGHAYLFTGQEMIGKRTFALELANQLTGHQTNDSLLSNPDILFINSDGSESGQTIAIEEARRIKNFVSLSSGGGQYKFVVIDDANLMTPEAQNALLKILEEPNRSSILILVTASSEALLPTITSRCEEVRFDPHPRQLIGGFLNDSGLSKTKADFLIEFANGRLGLVKKIVEEKSFDEVENSIEEFMGLIKEDINGRLMMAQKLTDEKNKAELPKKLLYWILYLRIRLVEPKSHKILKGLLSLNEIISKPQFNQRLALENFLVQL